jgi:hypothetical protein
VRLAMAGTSTRPNLGPTALHLYRKDPHDKAVNSQYGHVSRKVIREAVLGGTPSTAGLITIASVPNRIIPLEGHAGLGHQLLSGSIHARVHAVVGI